MRPRWRAWANRAFGVCHGEWHRHLASVLLGFDGPKRLKSSASPQVYQDAPIPAPGYQCFSGFSEKNMKRLP